MMTSYFAFEIAGEVLRLHDFVIDAALLEHPHLPAGRHVAGGLVEANLGVRLQALAFDRRRAYRRRRRRMPSSLPNFSTIGCDAAVDGITHVPGAYFCVPDSKAFDARYIGTFAFCSCVDHLEGAVAIRGRSDRRLSASPATRRRHRRNLLHELERRVERLRDRIDADARQHPQRVTGDVVRRLRRSAGEQCAGPDSPAFDSIVFAKRAIGLRRLDHERSGGVLLAVGAERRRGL